MYKNFTIIYGKPPGCLIKLLVIMKLTTFILITTLLQVSAATFGQRVTLKDPDLSIEKAFKEIRKQTGYDVLMQVSTDRSIRVNANFKSAPLKQVLDFLIKGTELT